MSETDFPVEIKRSSRRRTWSIHVYPGGKVQLSVPENYSEEHLKSLVQKHSEWILKKRKRMLHVTPTRLSQKWIDGEKIVYGGQEYILKIQNASSPRVRIENTELICEIPNRQGHWVKRVVEEYFREQTEILLKPLITKWVPRMKLKETPPLTLRRLNRSWGLCKSDGRITLHWHLSRLHPDFAEYILVHELCHLFHMNHGKEFKNLLSEHLPHWRQIKKSHEPVTT